MFDSHRATFDHDFVEAPGFRFPFAIVYFMLLFVIGNLLLFNLFIAILLSNFEDEPKNDNNQKNEPARRR